MVRTKSFQQNLFLSVGALFILFVLFFCVYQYNREREYRIDVLHSRLQMYNYEMAQTLGSKMLDKDAFYHYVSTHAFDRLSRSALTRESSKSRKIDGMRVTLIDEQGNVLLDSEHKDVRNIPNHRHRTEVIAALRTGNGYDIKRVSKLTDQTYFYSATHVGKYIVRSAVPYNAELTRSLQADYTYIWFAALMTLLLGFVLYRNTSRISRHIGYLREFAVKAEQGEEIDHELERSLPDDELGDISHTIISLYWKLQHAEEDKARIKRQLTQNAAHELKTPAASIHGYLESIMDNPDMDADKRQHFLERCYAQSERMNKLLLDMSTLTKLEASSPAYLRSEGIPAQNNATTEINVSEIINNVLSDTALDLEKNNMKVDVNIPSEIIVSSPLGEKEGASSIYSIFRNLVDNAIAYATDATKLIVSGKEVQDNGSHYYEFAVIDNGQGVEIQHLQHLFERFYRVDKGRSRKLGGTGLGLAIVKNAVAAHGGTATAEPTPGGGLTIRFTLK